jgi:hypothetical protein
VSAERLTTPGARAHIDLTAAQQADEIEALKLISLDRGRLDVYALVRWVAMLGLIALLTGRALPTCGASPGHGAKLDG